VISVKIKMAIKFDSGRAPQGLTGKVCVQAVPVLSSSGFDEKDQRT
jgi:hypothetical protein